MTPERWQHVNELYHEAQACAPHAREAFLRAQCAGDEALFVEVTSLLAADEKADEYLATPALELEAKALAAEQTTALPMQQLAHYEILGPLGAGGMGEVWRARDTRLGREVALKTLPLQYTLQPDRLQRFKREAQTTSALNHPNILTVYDIGQVTAPSGELHFIATELLDGTELRALLPPKCIGLMPQRMALDYARQIVSGLAAAHEKGIVHRDLKPENLFVTHDGRVKILDFGLAKLKPPQFAGAMEAQQQSEHLTGSGLIIGTVRYMSPEQLRGEEVDQRSDLFSFGLILYEMLRGQHAFHHESMAETMAAILNEQPLDLCALNLQISPQLESIVRHCLEKKPERRFQSARDLNFALEALSTPSGERLEIPVAKSLRPKIKDNSRLGWWVAAALLLGMLGFAYAYFRRSPVEQALTFTYLPVPEKTIPADISGAVFSPDGRHLVTTAVTEGVNHLWLYSLGMPTPRLLPHTEGGHLPFWSPDSQSIGFFDFRNLKRMDLAGGVITIICPAPIGTGGTWNNHGEIIFATQINGSGLYRVTATGGSAVSITSLDAKHFETGHNSPYFLPDGRHFLFFTQAGQPDFRGIQLGSLDDPKPPRFLLKSDAKAEYSAAGYLLFMRGRKILAQQFDTSRLTLSGEPIPLTTEPIYYEPPFRYADLSVVGDQLLLYRSGGNPNTQLTWFDRDGRQLGDVGEPGQYRSMQLSPDGNQVILDRNDPQVETSDIWKFDLLRGMGTRLTSDPGVDTYPIWSPDGSRMVFVSNRDGIWGIYEKGANSDDNETLLMHGDQQLLFTSAWSPDGKFIVYRKHNGKTRVDIELLPMTGDRQPRNYLATEFTETYGSVSPDGHWLAYQSDAEGRVEIYVQSFPNAGRKVRISQGGGQLARWRQDGKELYYVAADDKLMAVPVQTSANLTVGTPVALFMIGSYGRRTDRYMYDVSTDGEKFLVIRQMEDASVRPLTVVQNWTKLLENQGNAGIVNGKYREN